MRKPSFEEFLRMIYNMSYNEYLQLDEYPRRAVDIDYKDRYETERRRKWAKKNWKH